MASVTVECHSLQDIVNAWDDGWVGCHLDKQTMKLVVEMIAAQQGVQPTCANAPDGEHHFFSNGNLSANCLYCGASG